MSNEIISVIDHLCDKLGIAVDWTADNAMPMIQQLIEKYARYLLVNNIAWLCVWVVLFTLSVAIVVAIIRGRIKNADWAYDDICAKICVTFFFAALIFFVFISICVSQLIKAATIPEIYAAQKLLLMLSNM